MKKIIFTLIIVLMLITSCAPMDLAGQVGEALKPGATFGAGNRGSNAVNPGNINNRPVDNPFPEGAGSDSLAACLGRCFGFWADGPGSVVNQGLLVIGDDGTLTFPGGVTTGSTGTGSTGTGSTDTGGKDGPTSGATYDCKCNIKKYTGNIKLNRPDKISCDGLLHFEDLLNNVQGLSKYKAEMDKIEEEAGKDEGDPCACNPDVEIDYAFLDTLDSMCNKIGGDDMGALDQVYGTNQYGTPNRQRYSNYMSRNSNTGTFDNFAAGLSSLGFKVQEERGFSASGDTDDKATEAITDCINLLSGKTTGQTAYAGAPKGFSDKLKAAANCLEVKNSKECKESTSKDYGALQTKYDDAKNNFNKAMQQLNQNLDTISMYIAKIDPNLLLTGDQVGEIRQAIEDGDYEKAEEIVQTAINKINNLKAAFDEYNKVVDNWDNIMDNVDMYTDLINDEINEINDLKDNLPKDCSSDEAKKKYDAECAKAQAKAKELEKSIEDSSIEIAKMLAPIKYPNDAASLLKKCKEYGGNCEDCNADDFPDKDDNEVIISEVSAPKVPISSAVVGVNRITGNAITGMATAEGQALQLVPAKDKEGKAIPGKFDLVFNPNAWNKMSEEERQKALDEFAAGEDSPFAWRQDVSGLAQCVLGCLQQHIKHNVKVDPKTGTIVTLPAKNDDAVQYFVEAINTITGTQYVSSEIVNGQGNFGDGTFRVNNNNEVISVEFFDDIGEPYKFEIRYTKTGLEVDFIDKGEYVQLGPLDDVGIGNDVKFKLNIEEEQQQPPQQPEQPTFTQKDAEELAKEMLNAVNDVNKVAENENEFTYEVGGERYIFMEQRGMTSYIKENTGARMDVRTSMDDGIIEVMIFHPEKGNFVMNVQNFESLTETTSEEETTETDDDTITGILDDLSYAIKKITENSYEVTFNDKTYTANIFTMPGSTITEVKYVLTSDNEQVFDQTINANIKQALFDNEITTMI